MPREEIGPTGDPILDRISDWARNDTRVRLVVLGGSRGRGDPAVDAVSDYDVSLFVTGVGSFANEDGWYEQFGPVLIRLRGKMVVNGEEVPTCQVLYADTKARFDFAVYHVRLAQGLYASHRIPESVKLGYRVLLDKDSRAYEFKRVDGQAFIPARPTPAEFIAFLNEFWWETTVAAKHLARRDLLQAKYSLDCVIRHRLLDRLLAWRVQAGRDWRCNAGKSAWRSRDLLPPEEWAALLETYAGSGVEDNWRSLFALCSFFRRVAREVAAELGHPYPARLESEVSTYLEELRAAAP